MHPVSHLSRRADLWRVAAAIALALLVALVTVRPARHITACSNAETGFTFGHAQGSCISKAERMRGNGIAERETLERYVILECLVIEACNQFRFIIATAAKIVVVTAAEHGATAADLQIEKTG